MKTSTVLDIWSTRTLALTLPPIILCFFFVFYKPTCSIAEEVKLQAELIDSTGNKVKLSSIKPDDDVIIFPLYDRGEHEYQNWAKIQSKLRALKSIRLANTRKKHWTVTFINGHEILAIVQGKLSGVTTLSGLPSIPFSIGWEDIKELTISNPIQEQIAFEKGGLYAQIKLTSGIEVALSRITTRDLHESSVYYGLFYGDRDNILPLILNDYEIDIPIRVIRKITFSDHKKNPLVVDIVYRPIGAEEDIELKGKKIGYGVSELQIKGDSVVGSWQLDLNSYVGHGLLSMENFSPEPKDKEPFKRDETKNKGSCITLDEKKWSVKEFKDVKINVEIGKGQVDLALDSIRRIQAAAGDFGEKKLEILLRNGETIAGRGSISGTVRSVDEYGITVKIPSSAIKSLEVSSVE